MLSCYTVYSMLIVEDSLPGVMLVQELLQFKKKQPHGKRTGSCSLNELMIDSVFILDTA